MVEEFLNDGKILKIVSDIADSLEFEKEEVRNWLCYDEDNPGFQLMTQDKIIDSLINDEQAHTDDSDEGEEAEDPDP